MSRGSRVTANSPKPEPKFTVDDFAAALAELAAKQTESVGLTSDEWTDLTGWPPSRVREALRRLGKAGRLISGRRAMQAIDGGMRWSPTYMVAPR